MSIDRIFPVVIARNELALLELTLSGLREFAEVIVHLPQPRDDLVALCAAYPNTHVVVRDDLLGGRARNHGASVAAGEWILALTAGEFPSDSLLASLKQLELDRPNCVYAIERHALFMGQPMRWGRSQPAWPVRLYNRHRYQFRETAIDERLMLGDDTRRKMLKGVLWSEAVESLDGLLRETADRVHVRRHRPEARHTAAGAWLRSLWTFVASFFLRLGCLEGRRGLIVAVAATVETFFASVESPRESTDLDLARTLPEEQGR